MKPSIMTFHGETMSPFRKLPSKMILAVLKFVDLKDKQHCRLICRRWRWILNHPDKDASLISFKAVVREIGNLEAILSSHLEFEAVKVEGVDKPWPKMTDSEHGLPPIRKLFIGIGNSERIVANILQFGCVFTENITLDAKSLENVGVPVLSHVLMEVKWENLSDLDLSVDIPNPKDIPEWPGTLKCIQNHFAATAYFLSFATIPNLKVFRFSVTSTLETEFSPMTINMVSTYTTFIQHHSKSLKKLYLGLQLKAVDFPKISDPVSAHLASHQEWKPFNLNLEALEIKSSHFLVVRHLVPPCFWDLDKLETVIWCPNNSPPNYSHLSHVSLNRLESLIQRNQTTIVEMSVSFSGFYIEVLDFTWLSGCTALRKLTLENFSDTSSVEIQLPRVTILEVRHFNWHWYLLDDVCAWIARSFRNVEIVKIIGDISESNTVQLEWLESLLPLRNLRVIHFTPCTKFDNLVGKFCQNKPQMIFTPNKLIKCANDLIKRSSVSVSFQVLRR